MRPGRSAVTRAAGASAPGGLTMPTSQTTDTEENPSANGSGTPIPLGDLDFDPMLDPDTLFGGLDGPSQSQAPSSQAPSSQAAPTAPVTAPTPVSPPAIPPPAAHFFAEADDGGRPMNPGFGKMNAPPSGSTVHEELPKTQLRSLGTPGQMPLTDGFDELMQSIMPPSPPNPGRPVIRPTPATPPQRLMGVSDVLSHARTTSGGPASAVPKMSSRDADFFVMKPSNKKAKAIRTAPRTKLSGFTFILILLIVLAAVAVAIFYIHR